MFSDTKNARVNPSKRRSSMSGAFPREGCNHLPDIDNKNRAVGQDRRRTDHSLEYEIGSGNKYTHPGKQGYENCASSSSTWGHRTSRSTTSSGSFRRRSSLSSSAWSVSQQEGDELPAPHCHQPSRRKSLTRRQYPCHPTMRRRMSMDSALPYVGGAPSGPVVHRNEWKDYDEIPPPTTSGSPRHRPTKEMLQTVHRAEVSVPRSLMKNCQPIESTGGRTERAEGPVNDQLGDDDGLAKCVPRRFQRRSSMPTTSSRSRMKLADIEPPPPSSIIVSSSRVSDANISKGRWGESVDVVSFLHPSTTKDDDLDGTRGRVSSRRFSLGDVPQLHVDRMNHPTRRCGGTNDGQKNSTEPMRTNLDSFFDEVGRNTSTSSRVRARDQGRPMDGSHDDVSLASDIWSFLDSKNGCTSTGAGFAQGGDTGGVKKYNHHRDRNPSRGKQFGSCGQANHFHQDGFDPISDEDSVNTSRTIDSYPIPALPL